MDNREMNDKPPVSRAKRIWAMIAVILIIAVYVVGLVFAFMGNGYSIMVVTSCILLASYIAVYFHLGQVLVNLIKGKHKKLSEEGDKEDE